MFDDLLRHPGFAYLAFSAFTVAIIWMIYRYKYEKEAMEVRYAMMDLLWKIWGRD